MDAPLTFIIDGGCYTFVDQIKTFTNAKIYCESKQARLFEPRSVNTNKLVYEKSKDILRGQSNWLGVITKNGKSISIRAIENIESFSKTVQGYMSKKV